MEILKHHIYLANLNPSKGKEPGKVRPVAVVQTDLLNDFHPTVVICPVTSMVIEGVEVLRVRLKAKANGLDKESDILVDQIRSIDKVRIIEHIGKLTTLQIKILEEGVRVLLFQ